MTNTRLLGSLPEGDLFVHCGDILMSARLWTEAGQVAKLRAFNAWLDSVPCTTKVIIMGNHERVAPSLGRTLLAEIFSNAQYLENEACNVAGLSIFATPLSSKGRSGNSAFQDEAFAAATEAAANATEKVDILITHGPAQQNVGSSSPGELETWAQHLQPRLHLWGHAHGLHGVRVSEHVVSVCASVNDIDYCPIQLVAVIDIKPLLDGAILGETSYVDTTRC